MLFNSLGDTLISGNPHCDLTAIIHKKISWKHCFNFQLLKLFCIRANTWWLEDRCVYIYICIMCIYIYVYIYIPYYIYIWQQIWLGSWLDYTMIIMNLLWLDTRCRLSTSRGNILGKIVPKLSTAWFSFHTPQVPHMKKGSILSQNMKTSVEGVWDRISFFRSFGKLQQNWKNMTSLEWHSSRYPNYPNYP